MNHAVTRCHVAKTCSEIFSEVQSVDERASLFRLGEKVAYIKDNNVSRCLSLSTFKSVDRFSRNFV